MLVPTHAITASVALQAPKPQVSKEAKALAASNSSKGKKKVQQLHEFESSACYVDRRLKRKALVAEMVQGQDEGVRQQSGAF